jgi:hypothetical protein
MNEYLKSKIQKHLTEGKEKLVLLEKQIISGKNGQKLKADLEKAKEKLMKFKKAFDHYEEKAVHYTEKNPKKALAMATAAGILAATIFLYFKKKKTTKAKPKPSIKAKKIVAKPRAKRSVK